MSVRLPDDDLTFYLSAASQTPPRERPTFEARVSAILQSHRDPGPGDVNRAVRVVLNELRGAPPPCPGGPSRWSR